MLLLMTSAKLHYYICSRPVDAGSSHISVKKRSFPLPPDGGSNYEPVKGRPFPLPPAGGSSAPPPGFGSLLAHKPRPPGTIKGPVTPLSSLAMQPVEREVARANRCQNLQWPTGPAVGGRQSLLTSVQFHQVTGTLCKCNV